MTAPWPDILSLENQLDCADSDAQALIAGLGDRHGAWRRAPGSWSVAECLDHIATANRVYVQAMKPSALRARSHGQMRRGPAKPGLLGAWSVRTLEPPVKRTTRMKAPGKIVPRIAPPLSDAYAAFVDSQLAVRAFLREIADLDLNAVRFPNPFIRGIRFSVATGLNVITAHERRHLWQAWNVRHAAETEMTRN